MPNALEVLEVHEFVTRHQIKVDTLTNSLPELLKRNERGAIVAWVRDFTLSAAFRGVEIEHKKIYKLLKKSGYEKDDFVELYPEFYHTPYRIEAYLVGQLMDFLAENLKPHDSLVIICNQYFEIAKTCTPPRPTSKP